MKPYIDTLLASLSQLCRGTIVLTGVGYTPQTTGVVVYHDGEKEYYSHEHLDAQVHGTDIDITFGGSSTLIISEALFPPKRVFCGL